MPRVLSKAERSTGQPRNNGLPKRSGYVYIGYSIYWIYNMVIFDTDASDSAIGSVLSQIQDGEEKVIFAWSQIYNKN